MIKVPHSTSVVLTRFSRVNVVPRRTATTSHYKGNWFYRDRDLNWSKDLVLIQGQKLDLFSEVRLAQKLFCSIKGIFPRTRIKLPEFPRSPFRIYCDSLPLREPLVRVTSHSPPREVYDEDSWKCLPLEKKLTFFHKSAIECVRYEENIYKLSTQMDLSDTLIVDAIFKIYHYIIMKNLMPFSLIACYNLLWKNNIMAAYMRSMRKRSSIFNDHKFASDFQIDSTPEEICGKKYEVQSLTKNWIALFPVRERLLIELKVYLKLRDMLQKLESMEGYSEFNAFKTLLSFYVSEVRIIVHKLSYDDSITILNFMREFIQNKSPPVFQSFISGETIPEFGAPESQLNNIQPLS